MDLIELNFDAVVKYKFSYMEWQILVPNYLYNSIRNLSVCLQNLWGARENSFFSLTERRESGHKNRINSYTFVISTEICKNLKLRNLKFGIYTQVNDTKFM
jgi:hypothetical protein